MALGACAETAGSERFSEQQGIAIVTDAARCTLDAPPSASRPDTIRLQESTYPCKVVAVQLPVELTPSSSGERPDPSFGGMGVARDSRGTIYTAVRNGPPAVLRWDATGTFKELIGRPGEGPGEFAGPGALIVHVGWGDSLVVLDGSTRASVFDAEGRFSRVINAPQISRRAGTLQLLDDGTFLSSAPLPAAATSQHAFTISDSHGAIVRSFGPEVSALRHNPHDGVYLTAYAGGNEFWSLDPSGTDYVLRKWGTDGTLLQTLVRESEAFRPAPADRMGRPAPEFLSFRIDPEGRLWVVARTRDARWRSIPPQEEAERRVQQFDIRFEVIDPDRAEVLASGVIDDGRYSLVFHLLPRSTWSYRPRLDEADLATVEFFELQLESAGSD